MQQDIGIENVSFHFIAALVVKMLAQQHCPDGCWSGCLPFFAETADSIQKSLQVRFCRKIAWTDPDRSLRKSADRMMCVRRAMQPDPHTYLFLLVEGKTEFGRVPPVQVKRNSPAA